MNVKARAEAVGTLRHVNVFLMQTLAGWVPSTPEMEVKVLFGRHLWLVAQLADRLGRRARELRAPLHYDRPPSPGYASALVALAAETATASRLEGFYAAGLVSLERAYADYLARTDALIDEPTVVILQDALRDIARMRAECDRLLGEFPALRAASGASPELRRLLREAPEVVEPMPEAQTA